MSLIIRRVRNPDRPLISFSPVIIFFIKRLAGIPVSAVTKEFIVELSAVMQISITDIIITKQGADQFLQGTWITPQVAIHLAQWVSPEFSVKVTEWFYEEIS